MTEGEFRKSLEAIVKPEGKEKPYSRGRVAGPIVASVIGAGLGIFACGYFPEILPPEVGHYLPAVAGFLSHQKWERRYSEWFCKRLENTDFSSESLPRGLFSGLETELERDPKKEPGEIMRYVTMRKTMPKRLLASIGQLVAPTADLLRMKGAAEWLRKSSAKVYNLENAENIPSPDYLNASSISLDAGRLYDSVMYYTAALWALKEEHEKSEETQIVLGTGMELSYLRRSVRLSNHPEREAIKLANLYFSRGHQDKAEEIWDLVNDHYPNDMGIQVYDALRLGFLNRGFQARQKWGDVLSLIDKRGFTYETVGEYRNEVLKCSIDSPDAEAIGNLLFFKKSKNPEFLETEFKNLKYFNKHFKGRVTQPVSLVKQDDSLVSVMFSAGKHNLFQRIIEQDCNIIQRKDLILEASEFLAEIHAKGTEGKKELGLEDKVRKGYFTERVSSVFVDQSRESNVRYDAAAVSALIYNYTIVDEHLAVLEGDFYKDANLMNWVDSKLGVQAIDFEGDKLLPCQLDLVSLLEFGGEYYNEKEVEEALNIYIEKKQEVTERNIDSKKFKISYHYAAIQRHLELAGYRNRDISKGQNEKWCKEAVHYHLVKAWHHTDKLRKYEKLKNGDGTERYSTLSNIMGALQKIKVSLP